MAAEQKVVYAASMFLGRSFRLAVRPIGNRFY
jgi:hypothetical protein